MDIEKTEAAVSDLSRAAAGAQSPELRAAIDAAVEVSKRALADARAVAEQRKAADALVEQSKIAVEKAATAEWKARKELADEKAKVERIAVAKSTALADAETAAEIQKHIQQVVDAVNGAFPVVANIIALKRWTWRESSQQSILTDTVKSGPVLVWNPHEDYVTEVPNRDHAIALVKAYVAEYVHIAKIGSGINCDVKPEHPARPAVGNSAPAEWPPRDLDHEGVHGPRIADEDDDS